MSGKRLPLVPLSSLAEVNPSTHTKGLRPGDYTSFVSMSDVSEHGAWLNKQARQISDVSSGFTSFADGDVLFAKITPCMENGKGCHATDLINGIGFGSTEFHVLRARSHANARFIFHWTQSPALRKKAEAFMIGSAGQQRVQTQFFDQFRVPSLAVPEQQCVAEILDTFDETIRGTERVIAKLQQTKQGLLYDLLTRGMDDNGELRDPERHPEQFMDSPLGRIPKAWRFARLRQALRQSPQNGLYKPANAIGRGVLMVGQTAFTSERSIDFGLARRAQATRAEIANWGLKEEDILVTRVFATVAGVGQPVLVSVLPEPAVYESNMMRLTVDREQVHPALVFHWLRHPSVRGYVAANANSSNQTSINQVGLGCVPLALPGRDEQSAILQVIQCMDRRLQDENQTARKLLTLKAGLMDDLLTGRVRVPVPEEAAR